MSASTGGSTIVEEGPQYSSTIKVGEKKLFLFAEVTSPSPYAMISIVKVSVISDSLEVQNTRS